MGLIPTVLIWPKVTEFFSLLLAYPIYQKNKIIWCIDFSLSEIFECQAVLPGYSLAVERYPK